MNTVETAQVNPEPLPINAVAVTVPVEGLYFSLEVEIPDAVIVPDVVEVKSGKNS